MSEIHKITFHEIPPPEDLRVIREGYDRDTEKLIGEEGRRELAFFVRDGDGEVVGGINGVYSNYGWLWIGLLWVKEDLRGQGSGSQLMARIEEEARSNGCTNAYLNSFSFQAVGFYQKLGDRIYGELDDFPPGQQVCALTKRLIP